jgi:hypothetical protein
MFHETTTLPTPPVSDRDAEMMMLAGKLTAAREAATIDQVQGGFEDAAHSFVYAMRDALRHLKTVTGYTRDSLDVRNRMRSLGIDPDNVLKYLELQENAIWLAKNRTELQLYGRTYDTTGH